MAPARRGVRIGVDVGSVRIGVAVSDPDGLVATPLTTVRRAKGRADLDEIADLVAERAAVEVVLGLPTSLSGRPGPAAEAVLAYAEALAGTVRVPVRVVDERFSTVAAQRALHATGVDTRRGRAVVDQTAAAIILQWALDAERATGARPGRIVGVGPATGPTEDDDDRGS
jgi:putative Holliday junction resolvase